MRITLSVRISGRVHGVGYRAWLVDAAREAGLDGWVRNCRDGTVEALLVGPEPAVRAVVQRCHEGPARARVQRIEVTPVQAAVAPGFEVRPTA